jgi:hypothetical protein
MTEATPPAAVKLIRPSIYAGVAVSMLGAALVSGKLALGFSLVWNIMVLALGIAILLFGVLAALSWRIAKTAMANEAAGIEPPPYDDDDE